jgi:hypothetical protein
MLVEKQREELGSMLGLEFQQVEDEEGQGSIHSC